MNKEIIGMTDNLILDEVFEEKRCFFDDGNTRSYEFRVEQLVHLKDAIKRNEDAILDALYADFKKPKFEAFSSEVGFVYEEINHTLKNLKKWMKPKKVGTPIVLELSKSKIYKDPLGVVLIIGPWNYPFQLLISPLVGAIAAGNCVVLKPSNETPYIAKLIENIISDAFANNYISVVQGPGHTIGNALIEKFPWNHIFFTGSPNVGKLVAKAASAKLSPVTLELGGKSPAIVDANVNIDKAAKRIVFGKFFNAGQTCVSPDYVLVHESNKLELIELMGFYIDQFYGANKHESTNFARIVNKKRFTAILKYLEHGKIVKGGSFNEEDNFIEPTIIDEVNFDMPIMQDEIFGPVLPVVTWTNKDELIAILRKNRYPLASYIFSESKKFQKFIIQHVEFGGGSINNTLVHLINPKLPFGGVGTSGMGHYHGKYSFDTFSHCKSVLKSSTNIDVPLRYAPYTEQKIKWIKRFFK